MAPTWAGPGLLILMVELPMMENMVGKGFVRSLFLMHSLKKCK